MAAGSPTPDARSPAVERSAAWPTRRSSPFGAVPGYGPIFNAGAIFHDGRFHLFARGVHDGYRRNTRQRRALPRLHLRPARLHLGGRAALRVPAGARRELPGRDLLRTRTRGCSASARTAAEHFVMSYTNLPPPETSKFWRIGVHRARRTRTAASRLDESSGRVSARRASRTRTAIDLQPARRPRRADPPHLPEHAARGVRLARGAAATRPPATGTRTWPSSSSTRSSGRCDDVARRRRRRAAGRDRRRPAAALPRAGRARALRDQGGAARRRDRPGEVDARRADHAARARLGAGRATSTTSSSCRARSRAPTGRST